MAPGTRRGNRAHYHAERDDFEGLPVRQWRQETVNIVPPPRPQVKAKNDRWSVELPHGLPKDWNLLPPHTQDLLRAARSGRLYKRERPADEDDAEQDGAAPEKNEKKEGTAGSEGITVRRWKQVPRNAEDAGLSHLAKRQKNTITLPSRAALEQAMGPTVTRAIVRRIDASGNAYESTVILQEGQQVDGEVVSMSVVPASSVTNLQAQPATPRKKPPPQKRKGRGPGRGKKKGMVPLVASRVLRGTGAPGTGPASGEAAPPAADGIVVELQAATASDITPAPDAEQSMVVDSSEDVLEQAGEDGGDGMDYDEDQGDDADENGEYGEDMDEEMQDAPPTEDGSPSKQAARPRFPLKPRKRSFPAAAHRLNPRLEGSPLKQVTPLSPTDPSPAVSLASALHQATSNSLSGMVIDSVPDAAQTVEQELPKQDQTSEPDVASAPPKPTISASSLLPPLRDTPIASRESVSRPAITSPTLPSAPPEAPTEPSNEQQEVTEKPEDAKPAETPAVLPSATAEQPIVTSQDPVVASPPKLDQPSALVDAVSAPTSSLPIKPSPEGQAEVTMSISTLDSPPEKKPEPAMPEVPKPESETVTSVTAEEPSPAVEPLAAEPQPPAEDPPAAPEAPARDAPESEGLNLLDNLEAELDRQSTPPSTSAKPAADPPKDTTEAETRATDALAVDAPVPVAQAADAVEPEPAQG